MEPLYYQTPYVKEFDAIVTACRPAKHGFEVELSQTGFYPEGGGQPSDTGRIGEVHVTHVEEKHGVLFMRRTRRWRWEALFMRPSTGNSVFPTCSNIRENISYRG